MDIQPLALVIGFIAFLLIMALVLGLIRKVADGPRVKSKLFMTDNELEFLHRLESAVPELRFHCQVSMGALLQPAVSQKSDSKQYYQARGRFSQKIIDYVAQRRDNGQIVAIIELDDRTHNSDKDSKRDSMLVSAGYKTIRWQSKLKPDAAVIRETLLSTTS